MPAMLDDPTAPVIYRTSGAPPYPTPYAPLPADLVPRQVTLRDRSTIATLIPFSSPDQVPKTLVHYLCLLLNREIDKGDTYPMIAPLPLDSFGPYWFANFGAVMLLGEVGSIDEVWSMEHQGKDWSKQCLGSFYIKPNYPGRSSHVCNGGFLVTDAARNRGVGRLMGEGYLEWAPKLGYTYSVFNLVYESNVASLRIWDALGFKRIGRVKGCGNLRSFPDRLVDAIIFGRDLNGEAEDYLSEERFDKIRFYLKTNTYPNGSDRAEKSRLRSASAHYRLLPANEGDEEKLMLKGKEVISDPHKQYEIAHKEHCKTHGGINKTTAAIADKYHWVRIKETVSLAIRNCAECKEVARPSKPVTDSKDDDAVLNTLNALNATARHTSAALDQSTTPPPPRPPTTHPSPPSQHNQYTQHNQQNQTDQQNQYRQHNEQQHPQLHADPHEQHPMPIANMNAYYADLSSMPVDPQLMDGIRQYGADPNNDGSGGGDAGPTFDHPSHAAQHPHLEQSQPSQQQHLQQYAGHNYGGFVGFDTFDGAQAQEQEMQGEARDREMKDGRSAAGAGAGGAGDGMEARMRAQLERETGRSYRGKR